MSSQNSNYTCEPEGYLEPKLTAEGFGARPPLTVIDVFRETVKKHGERPCLHLKRDKDQTDWKVWTWNDYWRDCMSFAKTLHTLGVNPFKIVNVLGFNSPEWLISNCGCILAGCIAAGIYTTNTSEACLYISEHSRAEVVVVEGNKQLAKYCTQASNSSLKFLKALVVWGEPVDEALAQSCSFPVHSWESFLAMGRDVSDSTISERTAGIRPGHCCTLIYTSGTTGPPKAVMISHDNVTWTTANICEHYMDLNHLDRIISYLPLSHIAAQLIDIHASMNLGCSLYFARPDALKGTLSTTLKEVRPTFFFGVPRVWEKIQEKMVQIGRDGSALKKMIGSWAKGIGAEHTALSQFGAAGGQPFGYGCANSIVLSTIKSALGLDQAKGCFTAAAPIAPETLLYFGSLDIPVYEVFGQSECTGPHTVSFRDTWKIGYCGRPLKGTQSMVAPVTGELCYRGRHIFMGYMYMPDKTAETIDDEGYLHSGDVAEFDPNEQRDVPSPSGFMKITGRIKELIITAGGENVPPVLIENEMKAAMPALSNCMVIGDKRKFLAMLVCLKVEADKETADPTDRLAPDSLFVGSQIGSTATTLSEATRDPLWIKYINDGMKAANAKTTSNAQIVQKWMMLPVDFSEKAGELTPTLKLKRNVVYERHAALIESLYADSDNV